MYQQHLSYKDMTDYGCFYTPEHFVDNLIGKINNNINDISKYTFVDTSCGYGAFLNKLLMFKTIGCDIDDEAIKIAKQTNCKTEFFKLNTLYNFSRNSINLNQSDKIVIIGNPPYNDTTSKAKQDIKNTHPCLIDDDLKTRDMGISFLLSYNKLEADYVAVLHPLSYMIKKTNYNLLKPFFDNYELLEHSIVNSQEFHKTSKASGFPIIIALYRRSDKGLTFDEVMNMQFNTIDGHTFNLKYDYIRNYISKYPSKNKKCKNDDILFFTMRDINALKRSRTFIDEYCNNAIIVDKTKLKYYCYVDIFKDYVKNIPYYLGNIDVFIDNKEFEKIENVFITKALMKHPELKVKICFDSVDTRFDKIDQYFKKLLGENYVY